MQKKAKIPVLSKELINYLNEIFPEKCAELKDTEKEVFYKSGQRSVVTHLIHQKQIQEEN